MEYTQSIEQLRLKFLMETEPEEIENYGLGHGDYLWSKFKELKITDDFKAFCEEILDNFIEH